MVDFRLSPRAEQDIREIWHNVARTNEPAADSLLRRMMEKAELAAAHPNMGWQDLN